MGTQYVDDHRFLLYKGSTVTDITEAVSSPEARDELSALSVELTFTAAVSYTHLTLPTNSRV